MQSKKLLGLGCSMLVMAAQSILCTPASAQSAPPVADRNGSGEPEIVVTAQKREQAIIDVPLSITAVSAEQITRRGATAIEDLQYSVPGMSISQFAPGQQRIQLRGISVYGGLPTVGVYMDEMPLNNEINQTGQDLRLLDVQRIEVLRGPQGTLYGQGAMGGTIRYITNPVDFKDVQAAADGEVADVKGGKPDWRVNAMVNIPLVEDQLGLRVAGTYQNFGGWIDNPGLGERNVNSGHSLAVRAKLGMRLGENLNITVLGQHQELKLGAQNLSDENAIVNDRVPTPSQSRVDMVNLLATYDFGDVQLLSSTGYLYRKDRQTLDLTASFVGLLEAPAPFGFDYAPGTFQSIGLPAITSNSIFVQELRLASQGESRFGWTVGATNRDSTTKQDAAAAVTPNNVLPAGFELFNALGTYPEDSRSWAVFGEANYKILPELTATVGGRYFSDKREQRLRSAAFGAVSIDNGKDTFNAFSPHFNLSWQPSEQLNIYANVAKGFRSGGFNRTSAGLGLVTVPPSYDPETLWSYEGGAKFQSLDRSISAELAVYRNEWTDVQSLAFAPGSPTQFTINGAKLGGWGVDAALNWTPVRPLTLSVTAGWNDMKYKSTTLEHIRGDKADYVPRFTGSASAEYRFGGDKLPAFARIDYQYSDDFQVFIRSFQVTPAKSDKQHILNARIGYSTDRWEAAIFARNILDKYSITYPAFGSLPNPAWLQPRTIGVSLGFHY